MHALALNGSPRTTGNTAALLRHALDGAAQQGAATEFVNLGSLRFEGCRSCFACKRKDGRFVGRCALHDDATPVACSSARARATSCCWDRPST